MMVAPFLSAFSRMAYRGVSAVGSNLPKSGMTKIRSFAVDQAKEVATTASMDVVNQQLFDGKAKTGLPNTKAAVAGSVIGMGANMLLPTFVGSLFAKQVPPEQQAQIAQGGKFDSATLAAAQGRGLLNSKQVGAVQREQFSSDG